MSAAEYTQRLQQTCEMVHELVGDMHVGKWYGNATWRFCIVGSTNNNDMLLARTRTMHKTGVRRRVAVRVFVLNPELPQTLFVSTRQVLSETDGTVDKKTIVNVEQENTRDRQQINLQEAQRLIGQLERLPPDP